MITVITLIEHNLLEIFTTCKIYTFQFEALLEIMQEELNIAGL